MTNTASVSEEETLRDHLLIQHRLEQEQEREIIKFRDLNNAAIAERKRKHM